MARATPVDKVIAGNRSSITRKLGIPAIELPRLKTGFRSGHHYGAYYDDETRRVVAERLSTGRSEATTRLLLQLELVGLSRLGSNPLQVLKDNIPGYKLLREERSIPAATRTYD